jgi:hypothetical protein
MQDIEDVMNAIPPKIKPVLQVDHDTGSVMSGEYSISSNPILIQDPHGMWILLLLTQSVNKIRYGRYGEATALFPAKLRSSGTRT